MDELPIGILFACLALLICLSAFFSASETATTALNRYRLADQANKKNRKAIVLQRLLSKPDQLLGTILLGNNLVNNAAVAITTIIAWKFWGEAGVAISTAFITIVILVLAEIPPKTFAAIHPERIAYIAAYTLNILQRVLHPVVWLVSSAAKTFEFIPGFSQKTSSHSLDSDELRMAVKASESNFEDEQMNLLLGILELGTQSVDSVMIPRSEIHALDLDDDLVDIVEQLRNEKYARLPVIVKSLENIKGELEIRDLLQRYGIENITKKSILATVEEPIYFPEDAKILGQVKRLQNRGRNMGIVIDEYGDVMGLATLNGMLEDLAGAMEEHIERTKHGISEDTQGGFYLVDAKMMVRELNRKMNWDLPTEGANTLNGLILEENEDIPKPGQEFWFNGYLVRTQKVSETAVETVRIFPDESSLDESGEQIISEKSEAL